MSILTNLTNELVTLRNQGVARIRVVTSLNGVMASDVELNLQPGGRFSVFTRHNTLSKWVLLGVEVDNADHFEVTKLFF